jgi:hypothetical protein
MTRHCLLALALSLAAVPARAEVSRVDIATRTVVGTSGYEKIVGTVHFLVDPADLRNQVVVDLDKAPRTADGRVAFSSDLYILRPLDPARSNGTALVEVVNRGRKLTLNGFDRGGSGDPGDEGDLGDAFLMKQGLTLVFVGWQFDIRRQNGLMTIDVPVAKGVTGIVSIAFTPNDRGPEARIADISAYPPVDPSGADTTLTVRSGPFGAEEIVPRTKWRLEGNAVTMADGFEPGRTYQLSFRAADPPIAGLGFAAVRDVASWIKYASGAPARVDRAIAFGSSQSGRFLRTFLYHGFNTDESGRQVFDGVMAHISGASYLPLNVRWATPNALGMFDATRFPFANQRTTDPISGLTDGLLDNEFARAHQPKLFLTNSSVEYWGGGRSAALVHSTPDGLGDLTPPDNTRVYFFAGTQHSPSGFPPRRTTAQELANPADYWWNLRALLVAMEAWMTDGTTPPESQHPRHADQTIVASDQVAFPAIPGVQSPRSIPAARYAGIALPHFVGQVDADGNEMAGIRLPELSVPLGTYTGWNFRNESIGGTDEPVALAGSWIPFAATRAARDAAGDPRRSVAERYTSKDDYLTKTRAAADDLVRGRYLLSGDVAGLVEYGGRVWDFVTAR